MSIVNQYKPKEQRVAGNLYQLTLMRQQAREAANQAYDTLRQELSDAVNPDISTSNVIPAIAKHFPVILKGVLVGRKIIGKYFGNH